MMCTCAPFVYLTAALGSAMRAKSTVCVCPCVLLTWVMRVYMRVYARVFVCEKESIFVHEEVSVYVGMWHSSSEHRDELGDVPVV